VPFSEQYNDLYALISGIEENFPQSAGLVRAVQKSLNDTVIYNRHGESEADAISTA
jgi:hypothetical protein